MTGETPFKRVVEILDEDSHAAGLDEYPTLPIVEDVVRAMIKAGFRIVYPESVAPLTKGK